MHLVTSVKDAEVAALLSYVADMANADDVADFKSRLRAFAIELSGEDNLEGALATEFEAEVIERTGKAALRFKGAFAGYGKDEPKPGQDGATILYTIYRTDDRRWVGQLQKFWCGSENGEDAVIGGVASVVGLLGHSAGAKKAYAAAGWAIAGDS